MSGLFPYTTRPNTVVGAAHNQLSTCLFQAAMAIVGKHQNVNAFVSALTNELQNQLAKKYELPTAKVETDIQFLDLDQVTIAARLGGDDKPIVIIIDLYYLLDFMDTVWDIPVAVDTLGLNIIDALERTAKDHPFDNELAVINNIRAMVTGSLEGHPFDAIIVGKDAEHLYTFFVMDKTGHANKLGTYDLSQYVQIKLTTHAEDPAQDTPASSGPVALTGNWHDRVLQTIDENDRYPKEGQLVSYYCGSITNAWNLMADTVNPDNIRYPVASRALQACMRELAQWADTFTRDILEDVGREYRYSVEATSNTVEVVLVDLATGQREVARFSDEDVAVYLAHGMDWHPMATTFWIPQTRTFGDETPVQ